MLNNILDKISEFFGKMLPLLKENGFWAFFQIIFIVFIFLGGLFFAQYLAVSIVDEKSIAKQQEEHDYQIEIRKEIQPKIQSIIKDTRVSLFADRSCVLELHNGTNNTAGLPFIHASMTYEDDADNIENIDEDYQNLTLSRFTFPLYLHKHNYWLGSLVELKEIDPKMARRMGNNDVHFVAIVTLQTETSELGYLSITWCNDEKLPSTNEILTKLIPASQLLSKLLEKSTQK